MKIYRLESSRGNGVYADAVWTKAVGSSTSSERHPMPLEDGQLMFDISDKGLSTENYHFGFRSIKQYRQWDYKKDWRNALTNIGVTLKVYDVPN